MGKTWGKPRTFGESFLDLNYPVEKPPTFSTGFPQGKSGLRPLSKGSLKLFPHFPQALLLLSLNLKFIEVIVTATLAANRLADYQQR